MKHKHHAQCSMRYACLILALAVLLSGCTIDPHYASEKLFWQAEQKIRSFVEEKKGKLTKEDLQVVIAAYREAIQPNPFDILAAQAQFAIVKIYMTQKEYDKAQAELQDIVNNFSSNPRIASRAQFAIGQIFELKGEQEKALQAFEKITDLYPLSPLGLQMPIYLINYYKKINDKDAEEKAFRKSVRHYEQIIYDYAGTSVASLVQDYLARTYVQVDDVQSALKTWDDIMTRYPDTPQAVKASFAKAEIYVVKMKDIPKAIKIYEDTIKEFPDANFIKDAKLRLGDLYLANNQVEKGQAIFSTLIKDYPQDERVSLRSRFALVESFKKQGLQEKVTEGYQEIMQSYPDSPNALAVPYLMYRYYSKLEDRDASQLLNKAISQYKNELNKRSAKEEIVVVSQLLFLCYADSKQWTMALNLLGNLSYKYPDDPGFLLSMASLYRNQLNNPRKAIDIYSKVIENFSSNKPLVTLVTKQIEALSKSLSE